MKKTEDFIVLSRERIGERVALLALSPADGRALETIAPGQFVEILVDKTPGVFLRRPISVHFTDQKRNIIWLLIQIVGDGTRRLAELAAGDAVNLFYPLGHGFTIPEKTDSGHRNILLVGGGIGCAPLLDTGSALVRAGHSVRFLLGYKTAQDAVRVAEYARYGTVATTTEDGSVIHGTDSCRGFVTNHNLIVSGTYDAVKICGPRPMMEAAVRLLRGRFGDMPRGFCEISLENKMACGHGVCLCCVEDTREGNVCVCTNGPVFDINDLKW